MAALVAFLFIAIALLLIHTNAQEAAANIGFSYVGDTGPDKWGSLSPNFATCSTGKLQSPIDIAMAKAVPNKNLKPLRREYHNANATLVNHCYNIGMQFEDAGLLIQDGKNYTFQRMHWHTPSEHKINGALFDAELHLLNKATDGSIAVVAILYKIGAADSIITGFQSKLAELAKKRCASSDQLAEIAVGTFEAWKLRRNTRQYFRYVGSLTSPPCSENVIWNVFPTVRSISKEQLEALKAPLLPTCKSNSRPVQPLNGRQVELFDELKY